MCDSFLRHSGLRQVIAAALLFLVFSLAPALAAKGDREPVHNAVSATVAQILNGPERLPLPLERIRPALRAHYVRDAGAIYWAGTERMTLFIQRLQRAEDDGLNPGDYPIGPLTQIRDSLTADDPYGAAEAELLFSTFFVAYAADLKIGRVTPQKVDPRLFRSRKAVDVLRILTELKKQDEPGQFLSAFETQNPHYQALKKMLALYRGMAASGDWPEIPQGANILAGGKDARIPQIRSLLTLAGDYIGPQSSLIDYDPLLADAVKRFQRRNGLEAKGVIGKQTLIAMNEPPAERARQIMLNMERWRWMPETMGDYHFMVNLAAFELQEVRASAIVDRMDVVVGAVATQTPEFSDEMEYVEINPTWTVPYSIATGEMLPKLRADPYAYAADFDLFAKGKIAPWGTVDWFAYGRGNFPFTFRQRPGPKNALGKVKFMLPNTHNIYLHDTPAKDKFLATARAFSHGCIRLSRPIDLLYTLVGGVARWPTTKIEAALAGFQTIQVPLPRRIPVHLIYATAFSGTNGIEFRPDLYGRDRKLYAALFGKPAS